MHAWLQNSALTVAASICMLQGEDCKHAVNAMHSLFCVYEFKCPMCQQFSCFACPNLMNIASFPKNKQLLIANYALQAQTYSHIERISILHGCMQIYYLAAAFKSIKKYILQIYFTWF
jgi:hypothetical protein